MKKEKKCTCDACEHSKKFYSIIENLNTKNKKWMSDFYSHYMCIYEDLDYYKAIMEGNWPSAVEQLKIALKLAESKQGKDK